MLSLLPDPRRRGFEDDDFFSERFDLTLGNEYAPLARRLVSFREILQPGTILVDANERHCYLPVGRRTIRYSVGVGRDGFGEFGTSRVSRKAEWPGRTLPEAMRSRHPELPAYVPGGPGNPIGVRALHLGASLYRLHGTNNRAPIGRAMSNGCIRLTSEDVIDLHGRVEVVARVIVPDG